jgi:hypothetical protein
MTKKTEVESQELEKTALAIYTGRLNARAGAGDQNLVQQSFLEANRFLRIAARVRSGDLEFLPEPESRPTEYVDCPIMELTAEHADGRQDYKPILDPITKSPMTERLPKDPFAFAPNLPPDHAINLRYGGLVPVAQLIAEVKAGRQAEKDRMAHVAEKDSILSRIASMYR